MSTPLAELVSTWSIPRLRQSLAFASELDAADRAALEDELRSRGDELPPDPVESGLAEELRGWSADELRAAYLDLHDPYDWRQRGAIEAELAARGSSDREVPLVPTLVRGEGFSTGGTLQRSLSAGFAALSQRAGGLLGRTLLLGLAWFGLTIGLGLAASNLRGIALVNNITVPLYFVAGGALLVWVHFDLARLGLSAHRRTIASRGRRVDRLGAWVTCGLVWLVLLGVTLTAAVVQPLLAALLWLPLFGLGQGVVVCAQLMQAERRLTPLAALHAVGSGIWAHPLRWGWLGTCWGFLWGICLAVFVFPLCGLCVAPFLFWVWLPVSASAWAHVYTAFSGDFPPLARPLERWSFPGDPVPAWLIRMAALLLTISLWACSGGMVLVGDLANELGMTSRWVSGWGPVAALGGVAVVPLLVSLVLLRIAQQTGSGVVVDEHGLRLDVTGRWRGRRVPWSRVRGYRLSEQGVRFLLVRRPWSPWIGPLVPAREREAHELVEQLEAWGVGRG